MRERDDRARAEAALAADVAEWQQKAGVNQGTMSAPCQVPIGDGVCGLPWQDETGELVDHVDHLYRSTPFVNREAVRNLYVMTEQDRAIYAEVTARVEADTRIAEVEAVAEAQIAMLRAENARLKANQKRPKRPHWLFGRKRNKS